MQISILTMLLIAIGAPGIPQTPTAPVATPAHQPHTHVTYAGPCQSPRYTQADLNECFAKEAHKEDARLQVTYDHYLKILDEGNRVRLVESQAVWTQYRLAECKAVAGVYEGGSMEPMQYDGCWALLTAQRRKELRDDYIDLEY